MESDLDIIKHCKDCQEVLSAKELMHGEEGFGHQFRCCRCYDLAMGVPKEVVDRKHKK